MHPEAYAPGVMTYAYIKARDNHEAFEHCVSRKIDSSCVAKIAEVKKGELYMAHVVGHMGIIIDWFHEPGQAPYPYGTCVLYSSN